MAEEARPLFQTFLDKIEEERPPFLDFLDKMDEEEERVEKEERYREAELTSQPLPPLDLPTEEEKESWRRGEEEDKARAAEWYGGVKGSEEEAERNVKKAFLSIKPAPVAEVQIAGDELASAEAWWGNLQRAASGGWDATTAKQKREKMRAFAEAFTQMQSDGVLRQAFEMKLDDASTADQLKIIRALHDSRLWARDMDYGVLTPKVDRERMEKLPAEYHQGKVAPPKPPGFWENFLRTPTKEEWEPANLWKGWERDSAALLEHFAETARHYVPKALSPQLGTTSKFRPPEERGPIVRGIGSVGEMAPTLALSAVMTPAVARFFKLAAARSPALAKKAERIFGGPAAYVAPTALGTAGASAEFLKTGDVPLAVEAGLMWAVFPVAHKAVSGGVGSYLTKLLKKHPKLSKATQTEQGVVAEVAGLGSILAIMEGQNIPAYLEANPEERKEMLLEMLGRSLAFGAMGVYGGVSRPGPRGKAKPRELGPEGRAIEQLRRERNLALAEVTGDKRLMDIIQKQLETQWNVPAEAVPKGMGVLEVIRRMEKAKSGKTEAVQKAISEMQEKVKAGEFRVPRPEKLPEDLPIPELKAEEPPTPVEAEGLDVITPEQGKLWHLTPVEGAESVALEGIRLPKLTGADASLEGPPRAYATYHSNSAKGLARAIERMLSMRTNEDVANWAREKGVSEENIRKSIEDAGKRFNNETGKMERREVSPQRQYLHMQMEVEGIGKLPPNEFLWNDLAVKFIGSKGVAVLEGKAPSKIPTEIAGEELSEAGITLRDVKSLKKGASLDEHTLMPETNLDIGEVNKGGWKEIYRSKAPKPPAEAAADVVKAEADVVAAVEKGKAKIEEKATESIMEGSLLAEYIKNEKIRKFHKTIQRHMKGADAAEKARWAENPDSAYDVVPTSSWRRTIEKMSMEEIEADLSKNKDAIPQLGPELIVKSMLENRKAQLLKRRWRESKDPADWAEYESLVQELANPRTFAGQYIQAQRHFMAGDPIIEADVIAAAILNHKGPKLSKAERAELIELIDKSMEAKEKADKAAEEYWKDESDANWDGAIDALNMSEVATMNQIEFIANKTPKAVVDMLVATLQGNFLTPTTLMVNVAGNIAPLGPRALARIPARGLDMAEQFFMRDRRIAERNMLIDQQKKNPSVKVAARIEKLDKMLSPMEQIRLKPIEGTKEKFIGGWEGTGLPRVFEAIKKTREEGGNVMELLENFKAGKKSTLGMDSAGAIILGEKLNQAMLIEVGEMDMSSMTPTLDAATASKRLLNTIRRKLGREVKGPESIKAISDLYEAIFGLSPTVFFRLLAGGDIPGRNAELRRLIVEQVEIRADAERKAGKPVTWDATRKKRALERPSLIFNPKEWSALQFRAAQATFQHENRGTRAMQRVNKFIRGNSLKGELAYLALRDMTPYQKTLINVWAEGLNFTPFGLADVLATAHKDGFMSREAKISAGKVITGTTVMLIAERYLNNDIMSADLDPGMAETGDQRGARYMTEETYHHGFVNWDAAMRNMKGEDTAWQPGDYIADARRMGPFGYLLLNGANYHRSLEMMAPEDREKLSSSWRTLLKFTGESVQYSAKYAINQSFATGVRDKLRAVSRAMSADTGSDALKPIAGVLLRDAMTIAVPNTIGWWNKAGSPYKQTFKSDELSQTLKDEWARKTGAWDEDYPIIVDLWGTPLESMPRGTLYPGGLAKHKDTAEGKIDRLDRLMAVSFNIFRFKKSGTIMDVSSSEVYRLWRKFPKGNVVPPIVSPKITLDGVEYKLNRDQYAYYSAMTGRYRLTGTGNIAPSGPNELEISHDKEDGWGVKQFVNKGEPFMLDDVWYKDYMDVPDEIKAEEFKKIYRKATTAGNAMFVDWEKHKGTPKSDSIMRMFNIDPKNLPLTEDQIKKEPSGRAD